ncbi:hypothetical protein [Chryseobacterium sp. MA9]|uniref:hypothetical protein n=1 Tax=Chryseobacterium sp. MA9 TaxID=2966625 RepID=UPI002106C204|nr:hypothetical protein [Chryseobacterium sp. MA9]UTX48877.1 hypothetical protein KIK00_00995 [Chryseobacterium sp. MA9]
MKKLLLQIFLGLALATLIITACKHPEEKFNTAVDRPAETNIKGSIKDIFVNELGDNIEVTINNTTNTAIIHLDGKTYKLRKSTDLPNYNASNDEYQYSNIKGEITFLKKDFDMVLFHYNPKPEKEKSTRMASY